jgi:hypothetical protein
MGSNPFRVTAAAIRFSPYGKAHQQRATTPLVVALSLREDFS